jgi:glycosyltransferase involved in cell wall biosynthesis
MELSRDQCLSAWFGREITLNGGSQAEGFSLDEGKVRMDCRAHASEPQGVDLIRSGEGVPSASRLATVVIPCYKGARFLPEAIESCLRQTHRELEIIVVDDASPDNCAEIAERYARQDPRVRAIRHATNGGVSRAFNTGFDAARGNFMVRLAQDDFFREDAIEAMVRHLEATPQAGLTYGDLQGITESGSLLLGVAHMPEASRVLSWRNGVGLCVMWRRAVWETVGKFDPEFDTAEDFEYWVRVSQSYSLSRCPGGPFLFARTHDEQGSQRYADKQEAATNKIIDRLFPPSSFRNRMYRRRALSYNAYSAGTDYSYCGMQARALNRMIRSLVLWPLPFPSDGGLVRRFIRIRSLIVVILRILQLKRHEMPSPIPDQATAAGCPTGESSQP